MSKVVNAEVKLEDCRDDVDLLIKKFLRKCKKLELNKEFHKHDYYKKPSDKRREKQRNKERVLYRLAQKNNRAEKERK